jgi:hypothetical protein
MPKATTVRFTDEMFARLDQASARTGMPVNSIVIAACLEWMQRHTPAPTGHPRVDVSFGGGAPISIGPPRWSTISRAVKRAVGQVERPGMYPFERFSDHAKELLTKAQGEAENAGFSYIGTEHLLLAAFGNPSFHSARVLEALGVDEDAVRLAIQNAIGRKQRFHPQSIVPTSRVKKVIETAFALRAAASHDRVGTHHILLALTVEGEGIAAHVLSDLGATRERIEAEVGKLTEAET